MPEPVATTRTAAPPIRFGIHGSSHLAERIIAAAGHDPAEVDFVQYGVADPFGPLRAGEMDVMIVKYALSEPDVACSRPLMVDGRAVIVSADHPLAVRDTVSVEEVAEYDAFGCPRDFPPYVWDKIVPPGTPGGVPIRRVHPMTTVEAMVAVLTRTHAVHLSFRSLEAFVPPHIRVVPIHDLPAAPVSLAWRRDADLPAPVAQLISDAERSAEH
ncbi:MAG: LysR substrate-binding domain-containing protein [Pseudonocardiaceae bacterium]